MKRAAAIALACVACSRAPSTSGTTAAPSASTTSATSSATSGPTSTPTPSVAHLVRLPIAVARASSEVGGPTPHVAEDAFDGDPFDGWCAPKLGKDAWVEGELATAQRLRRVRIVSGLGDRLGDAVKSAALNGKVDLARVQLDAESPISAAIDPKTGDVFVELADGVVAKRVRVFVDAATKGKSRDDACLAEIELWGDAPAKGSPAGFAATLSGPDLDAAIAALPTSPRAKSVDLLTALGFAESVRRDVAFYAAVSGERRVLDLDADDALESLVDVAFAQRTADGAYVVERQAVAVLDDDAHDHAVLGRRWIATQQCIATPNLPTLVSLTPHVVHAPPKRDVVVRTTALDTCIGLEAGHETGNETGRDTVSVLTAERGMLETIAAWQTAWTNDAPHGVALFTPTLYLECTAGAPCGLGFDDAHQKTTRYAFEPKSFVYR